MDKKSRELIFHFFNNIFISDNNTLENGHISEEFKEILSNYITEQFEYFDVSDFDTYDIENEEIINLYFYVVDFRQGKDWNIMHSPYVIVTIDTTSGEITIGGDHS